MCVFLSLPTEAAEYRYSYTDNDTSIIEAWDKLTEALPDDVENKLRGFSLVDPSESANIILKNFDIRYFVYLILNYLKDSAGNVFSSSAPLFSLMILMATVQIILQNGKNNGLHTAFITYCSLVTARLLYEQTHNVLSITKSGLELLCKIMNLMTPIMETILISSGSFTQRAVSIQAITLFVTIAGNFTGYFLAPLTNLLFTLATISSVCDEVNLSHIIGSLRKFILRMIQLFTIFFSFMLGTQSILAKSADSLGMRTARFILGSFIPMAGSTIAEALSTVREGMSLIKSTAGIGGIIIIILLILPNILHLAVYEFALNLTGTASWLLGLNKFSDLVNQIHGIIELLMAVVLFTALMFLLILILFSKIQVTV